MDRSSRAGVGLLDRNEESVAPPRKRFNEPRLMRGILQCLPQAVDDGIYAVFKLDDSPVGPESLVQFPACDHFTGVFQQHRQDLDGLIGNPNLYTVPPQFSGPNIRVRRTQIGPQNRGARHASTLLLVAEV